MCVSDKEKLINKFLDGELSKSSEKDLFEVLATDEESREYFKLANNIKSFTKESMEEFPLDLEERIMNSVGSISESREKKFFGNRFFAVAAYALTIILLFLTFELYSEKEDYKREVQLSIEQANQNQQLINLLIENSRLKVQVTGWKNDKSTRL